MSGVGAAPVTISIGLAVMATPAEPLLALQLRVDRAAPGAVVTTLE